MYNRKESCETQVTQQNYRQRIVPSPAVENGQPLISWDGTKTVICTVMNVIMIFWSAPKDKGLYKHTKKNTQEIS